MADVAVRGVLERGAPTGRRSRGRTDGPHAGRGPKRATAHVAAGSMLTSYVLASRVGFATGALAAMIGGLGWCAASWDRDHGPATAVGLVGVYVGAFAVSHPVSRWVGAWPAVAAGTAATGLATHHIADRRYSTGRRSETPAARPDLA